MKSTLFINNYEFILSLIKEYVQVDTKKRFVPSEMHSNLYFIQNYWLETCNKNLLTEHDNGVVTTSAKTTNQCAISKTNMVDLSRII